VRTTDGQTDGQRTECDLYRTAAQQTLAKSYLKSRRCSLFTVGLGVGKLGRSKLGLGKVGLYHRRNKR